MKQRKPTDLTCPVALAWIAACFSAVVARRGALGSVAAAEAEREEEEEEEAC